MPMDKMMGAGATPPLPEPVPGVDFGNPFGGGAPPLAGLGGDMPPGAPPMAPPGPESMALLDALVQARLAEIGGGLTAGGPPLPPPGPPLPPPGPPLPPIPGGPPIPEAGGGMGGMMGGM